MIKIFRIILLMGILSFEFNCIAQITSDSNYVPSFLFQRWMLDYGESEGTKIQGLPLSPENDYEFKKDSTYILYSSTGSKMIGRWIYNSKDKCLYTKRDDGELNGKIVDLKPESFTLIPAGKEVEGTVFEKLRFYFIPKTE